MNAKTKIASSICAGFALASLLLSSASAQDLPTKLGSVSIVSLDRMALTNTGSAYLLAVDITFQNLNSESLKFRAADLEVILKSIHADGTTNLVDLGLSHLSEVVIPGGSAAHPGTVSATANVVLGPTNEATNVKLVQLFNAVGDPANNTAMLLNGSSELGLKLPNGWLFEQGKRLEVELTFSPTLQRKVLLN
jgi:hypothetical protein